MARPSMRLAFALVAMGLVGAVWYLVAGTHGCDEYGGNPACDRADRDFTIYVTSLTTIAVGLVATVVVALIGVKRRADASSSSTRREE